MAGRVSVTAVREQLLAAAQTMVAGLKRLKFSAPVTHVYNPLEYVWDGYSQYINKYAQGNIEVLYIGMNPGPFGMAQTGVPFGEVNVVKDWLKIVPTFTQPKQAHPQRPIEGVACSRSEVSGARLWALFRDRYDQPAKFFRQAFVTNYCPLAFMEESSRNRTPDKLPPAERKALYAICDAHLTEQIQILKPKWIVGIGQFAQVRAQEIVGDTYSVQRILHPSPASPASNRDWSGEATKQLIAAGIWE